MMSVPGRHLRLQRGSEAHYPSGKPPEAIGGPYSGGGSEGGEHNCPIFLVPLFEEFAKNPKRVRGRAVIRSNQLPQVFNWRSLELGTVDMRSRLVDAQEVEIQVRVLVLVPQGKICRFCRDYFVFYPCFPAESYTY